MLLPIIGGSTGSFSPTNISNIEAWYRGDLGITESSGVSGWADQSGNSRNLTQGTGTKPSYPIAGSPFNGHRYVSFNGALDYLTSNTFTGVSNPVHVFMVARQASWTNNDFLYQLENSGSNAYGCVQWSVSPEIRQFSTTGVNAVSASVGSDFLLETFFNGASSKQRVNNGSVVSGGNPGVRTMDRITLASPPTAPAQAGNIYVAEFIVYSTSEVTGTDYTQLRDYFNNRYSLW